MNLAESNELESEGEYVQDKLGEDQKPGRGNGLDPSVGFGHTDTDIDCFIFSSRLHIADPD